MKATKTTRPAHCIPAARLERMRTAAAAKKQVANLAAQGREDARQQLLAPTPEFEAAPRLTMLPGGLHWLGQGQVPQVRATVTISREGHAELARVKAYCYAAGSLGLVVEDQRVMERNSCKPGRNPRAGCVFGSQLALVA